MILAFTVYIGLLIFMLISGSLCVKCKQSDYWKIALFPIIAYSLIIGLRYDVGIDYLTYKENYLLFRSTASHDNFEWLFRSLNKFLSANGFHYSSIFILSAFISITCLFYYCKDDKKILPYSILFFFITSTVFYHLNLVRQTVSAMILLVSTKFIIQKRFVPFIFLVLVASGFHNTAFLFIPSYLLSSDRFHLIESKFVIIIVFVLSLFLGKYIFEPMIDSMSIVLQTLGYDYANMFGEWNKEVNSGLGIVLMHIQDITLLMLFPAVLKENFTEYRIQYRIFLIGCILSNLCGINMILSRLPIAYTNLKLILLAYLYYSVFTKWGKQSDILRLVSIVLLLTYILLFVVNILHGHSQCSPYQFVNSTLSL